MPLVDGGANEKARSCSRPIVRCLYASLLPGVSEHVNKPVHVTFFVQKFWLLDPKSTKRHIWASFYHVGIKRSFKEPYAKIVGKRIALWKTQDAYPIMESITGPQNRINKAVYQN